MEKIIFKKSSPDFGKPQKFHDFVFSSTEFKQKSFPPEKDSTSPGERSSEFRRFHFNQTFSPTNFGKQSSPQKMINLLQETKKKVEAKNLLSRFPEFDRRSIFAAALYEKLAAETNQVPAENILKSETEGPTNIGLLGQEDECECLSGFFFMRAHGIIHDACGRAYRDFGVGKGYCYAVENSTDLYEIFSIPWAHFRNRVLYLASEEIAGNL